MGTIMEPQLELPKADFRALDLRSRGGDEWNMVRAEVMLALEKFSAFEAMYDNKCTMEIREALFGEPVKHLFALPLDLKVQIPRDKVQSGYDGPTITPGIDYELLAIKNGNSPEAIEAFTRILWPQGNPAFREAVLLMANVLSELEKMVRWMVMESLGIEKHWESFEETTGTSFRLMEYRAATMEGEAKVGLTAHTDTNYISLVCQHRIPGLEVLSNDGKQWAVPSLNSITVMLADSILPWSNGRLKPCMHRAVIRSSETRHIAHFGICPDDEHMVEAPQELIDEQHPQQFKPFFFADLCRFKFSIEGRKSECPVRAFAGI